MCGQRGGARSDRLHDRRVDRRASLRLCESAVSYLLVAGYLQWAISREQRAQILYLDTSFFFHYELGWKLCRCVKFKKNRIHRFLEFGL